MKKKFFKSIFVSFALLVSALGGLNLLRKPKEFTQVDAVATNITYVKVTNDILAWNSKLKLYMGTNDVGDKELTLVSPADPYTFSTPFAPTGTMTLKNNGGSTINLYNISKTDYGTTWDMIILGATQPANFNGNASFTTGVYTPPVVGEQYTVTLYNGVSVLGTQTAYEDIVFTPSAIAVSGYDFKGWFTDAELTIPYVPSVLTGATSLYGKYEVRVATTIIIFLTSTNDWWYNASALTKIYYWVHNGPTAQVQTMHREQRGLDSVILPDNNFNRIKLERVNPSNPTEVWNATGDITVDLTGHPVIKLTGALNGGWTGPLTVDNFGNDSPYIATLISGVPALSCSNYANADTLLATYNGLAENAKSIIDKLHVTAAGNVEMSYIHVINYYVGYKAYMAIHGDNRPITTIENPMMPMMIIGLLGLLTIGGYTFVVKKTR